MSDKLPTRLGRFSWCFTCWSWERDDYDSTHHCMSDMGPEKPTLRNVYQSTSEELVELERLWTEATRKVNES